MGNCCNGNSNDAPDEANKGDANAEGNNDNQDSAQGGSSSQKRGKPTSSSSPPNKSSKQSSVGPVLGRPMEDIKQTYHMGKELGRGQFGVTHLCTHKTTGEKFACKTIAKRKLTTKEDIEDVKREVQIMHHLTGQANIVELKGAFEDKHSVHLIMELCEGGELFDRIIAKGHYSERAAASLMRTIVQMVHTCHSLGVIHRDLKPENFLLLNKDENSPLKATDFGLSVFYKQGSFSFYNVQIGIIKIMTRDGNGWDRVKEELLLNSEISTTFRLRPRLLTGRSFDPNPNSTGSPQF